MAEVMARIDFSQDMERQTQVQENSALKERTDELPSGDLYHRGHRRITEYFMGFSSVNLSALCGISLSHAAQRHARRWR
jgi:hypothetical protein